LEDLYESAHKIAKRKKKRAVVAFDEFQEIPSFDDGEIEAGMRSKFQFHRNVSYVFLGSKRKLMQKLFEDKNRPFYNSGRKYPLSKINAQEFSIYIHSCFKKTGIKIDDIDINTILEATKLHPYYTQELCHFIWEHARDAKIVNSQIVKKAINEILLSETAHYSYLWDELTAKQRGFLIALANHPSENVYSKDYIQNNQLGTASTIQRLIKLLYDKQIIEKENGSIIFEDVFFDKWVREKSAPQLHP